MKNLFWFIAGATILVLNKLRYSIMGYTRPRTFSTKNVQQCFDYDWAVVERWSTALKNYTNTDWKERSVLEIGPGPELGVGRILISLGARAYTAFDRFDLASRTPQTFYEEFEKLMDERLKNDNTVTTSSFWLGQNQTDPGLSQDDERIAYTCNPQFDLSVLPKNSFDVVVSNATFEHLDDIAKTIQELTPLVNQGGIFIADIDFQTHTRVLRDRDPLNIYRFPEWFYKQVAFAGIPNRNKPPQYTKALEQNGWTNIQWVPLKTLPDGTWLDAIVIATKL